VRQKIDYKTASATLGLAVHHELLLRGYGLGIERVRWKFRERDKALGSLKVIL